MKKYLLAIIFSVTLGGKLIACGGDYDPDNDYYNLFMQEIINDPQYYPFLLSLGSAYYDMPSKNIKNENIEEWEQYLGINYQHAYYLVFKSNESDIRKLIAGKTVSDTSLKFITPEFVQKHKQALLYIAYAKYLEPYMCIKSQPSEWSYYYNEYEKTADQLDYNKVMTVLKKSWEAETDKELKLRYGFQIVRFAHYNRKYPEAVQYFNTYVESLNYKATMYYYALSQKAGALMGLGRVSSAYSMFLQVFTLSKDLKASALNSLRLRNEDLNYDELLKTAKTTEERNNVYLLLGYLAFSNPLNEIEKIIAKSPDAIQAKVLVARAVNFIERDRLSVNPFYEYYYYDSRPHSFANMSDKRYPISKGEDPKMDEFFEQTLALAQQMSERSDVKDKNFWYITASYLHFLNKDYDKAKNLLAKVKPTEEKYTKQKQNLAMFIDICEQPKITNELEIKIFNQYKDVFTPVKTNNEAYTYNNTREFILDVLANRYFLQKDYAKSFLLNNNLSALERNPQLTLVQAIETFYTKNNKNIFEKYIAERINGGEFSVPDYLNYIKGVIYLGNDELDKASDAFAGIPFNRRYDISNAIFGYNQLECFECDEWVMGLDYMRDFPFIKESMNPKELTDNLIRLRSLGNKSGELSAKAYYLLGNFFYNVSTTGYYRQYLRFDATNGANYAKFSFMNPVDIYDDIYFKYYGFYYQNTVEPAQKYLEQAYQTAKDKELRARIAFALSKCEQEVHYENYNYESDKDYVMIGNRHYFKELTKYKGTEFYSLVKSNCQYFDYYVNNY